MRVDFHLAIDSNITSHHFVQLTGKEKRLYTGVVNWKQGIFPNYVAIQAICASEVEEIHGKETPRSTGRNLSYN